MRKRTASGKAHPVGGYHFGVFPWVFVSLRRSFTNKNRNFDTKRIGVTVLTFWQKRRVCGTFAPSGPKRKPGQVVFMVGFLPLRGLRGPRNR